MSALAAPVAEYAETFACFGSECTVIASDAAAVAAARRRLLEWHQQFSRFIPESELSRLNHDPRAVVQVSPMLRRVVEVGVNVDLLLPIRISDEEFFAVICADDAAAAERALGDQVITE